MIKMIIVIIIFFNSAYGNSININNNSLVSGYRFKIKQDLPEYIMSIKKSDKAPEYYYDYAFNINVYSLDNELIQTFGFESNKEHPDILFEDVNFDGYLDLSIRYYEDRHLLNLNHFFLWDSKENKFETNKIDTPSEYTLYPDKKVIECNYIDIWGGSSTLYYIKDNKLVPIVNFEEFYSFDDVNVQNVLIRDENWETLYEKAFTKGERTPEDDKEIYNIYWSRIDKVDI